MPRLYILSLFSLLLSTALVAQPQAERKALHVVRGRVVDAQSGKAIGYATVSLSNGEEHAITAAGTDGEGRFTLRTTDREAKHLCVSFVGYVSYIQPILLIEPIHDAGTIRLQQGVEIGEVVIGAKSLLRRESDRIVYDVSADPEASRVKMLEILRKIPQLQSNPGNGKLEYDNKPLAQLFINGQTDEVINRARQYPLDLIKGDVMKTIEVILPGSPEYGNTEPIINITLARPLPYGLAGEVAASASTAGNYAPALDLITKNKLGTFSASYAFMYKDAPHLRTESFRENLQTESTNRLQTTASEAWNSAREHQLQLGYARELFKNKATLRLAATTSQSDAQHTNHTLQHSFDAQGAAIGSEESFSRTRTLAPWRLNGGASLLYRLGALSNVGVTYTYTDTRTNLLQQTDLTALSMQTRISDGSTGARQHSVVAKLSKALGDNELLAPKFNAEVSYYTRHYENATHYYLYDETNESPAEIQTQFNGLDYQQQVAAAAVGLVTGRRKQKKFTAAFFLRGEYVDNQGVFLSTDNTRLDYGEFNLLPAASFALRPQIAIYKLGYTTRVLRPDVAKLNPYRDTSDPYHIRVGNPDLRGEYAHSLSASWGRTQPGVLNSINLKYTIEFIGNAIEGYTTVDAANRATTTYGNLGRVVRQGAEATMSFLFWRGPNELVVRLGGGYTRAMYDFTSGRNVVEGWTGRASVPLLRIGRRGPVLTAQYALAPAYASSQNQGNNYYSTLDMTLSKYFPKLKLGGQIAVTDLLHGQRFVEENIASESFRMLSRYERQGRIFSFSLYWRFGRFRDADRPSSVGEGAYDLSRPQF